MKVFISWSGDASKSAAEILRRWLPSVVQAIKPYFSPDDITKGSRWSVEIAKELEDCKVGLICLTAGNLEAPWVMFEAGALSKSLTASRVCPLLFGVEPSDIKGPLVQFQAAPFSKEEMKKAIRMMNAELGPLALASDVLDGVYDMWWPTLEKEIHKVIDSGSGGPKRKIRSERDILEEILARIRVSPPVFPHLAPPYTYNPKAIMDLVENYERLSSEIDLLSGDARGQLFEILGRLRKPIDHIVQRTREIAPNAMLRIPTSDLPLIEVPTEVTPPRTRPRDTRRVRKRL